MVKGFTAVLAFLVFYFNCVSSFFSVVRNLERIFPWCFSNELGIFHLWWGKQKIPSCSVRLEQSSGTFLKCEAFFRRVLKTFLFTWL